ncbi:carbon-nitrogen hydrolase family protein [Oleiphilus sp. HI0125]|uniref:carbon-nitrogen hydrolase family protein n=1 Tax=Oleiphilus sp. HI0125 TaxID=1822266 RepID=UPI0009EE1E5A|nr:carbon-nitrogen hydrolase family protein [Oleiphilus sp. HI0125]
MRTIKVASSLMDANPSPVEARLERAEKLIFEASLDGANLFLLPEMFNFGYAYDVKLFDLAESPTGKTYKFLKRCAKKYNMMIGGTFLVRENSHIYNRFMLISSSGEQWEYDKNYPWGWERGYFRGKHQTTIADTPLGKIGMLVCWDIAHTNLWEAYDGEVDFILASMSPPITTDPTYHLSDGQTLSNSELGFIPRLIEKISSAADLFSDIPKLLASELEVPVISSASTGQIQCQMPHPKALWLTYCAVNPLMWRHWNSSDSIRADFKCADFAQIIDKSGQTVKACQRDSGDAWASQEISFSSAKTKVKHALPKRVLPIMSYIFADKIFKYPSLMTYIRRS